MIKINPNNTVTIFEHTIPYDLFVEACKILVSKGSEGSGLYITEKFVVLRGIDVIRKGYVERASREISFRNSRKD